MAQIKGLSDFVLTGCAILPAMGMAFGRPEFALLSHIVLLFGGILIAGTEDDAPFKRVAVRDGNPSEQTPDSPNSPSTLNRQSNARIAQALHRQAADASEPSNLPVSGRKIK